MQRTLLSRTPWTAPARSPALSCSFSPHKISRTPLRFINNAPGRGPRGEIPSFPQTVAPGIQAKAFSAKIGRPGVGKQVLFFAFGSFFALSYAASRTNIETEYWKKKLTSLSNSLDLSTITTFDIKRAQEAEFVRKFHESLTYINLKIQELPEVVRPWAVDGLAALTQPWVDVLEGKRLCWKVCMLNAAVWAAWKIPRWQPAMMARFAHYPLSGLSYTLLTSTFSHRGLFHLVMNCLALEGYGTITYYILMDQQTQQQPPMLESTASLHFLSFFVSAGLFSSLVSHIAATEFRYPRLVAQYATQAHNSKKIDTWTAAVSASSKMAAATAAKKTIPDILPSLGSSGAIFACSSMTALAVPDAQIVLLIFPFFSFNIQWGMGGLVALDMIGILRGWRYLDHWAHLGGAAFGVGYYAYGPQVWQSFRRALEFEVPEN